MRKSTGVALAVLALAGCAPDQFSNYRATGFDGFIDQAAVECAPLQVGPMVITKNYDPPNYVTGQYGVWLDQTSNLYYKRISPTDYRNSVEGMLGQGSYNKQSFDCILLNLPAQRPDAPKGMLSM